MHKGKAIERAYTFAARDNKPMAVIHCGCGEYTVKSLTVAENNYPQDIRFIAFAPRT